MLMGEYSRRDFGIRLGTGAAAVGLMLGPLGSGRTQAAEGRNLIVGIPGFPSGFDAAVSSGVSDFVLRNSLDSLVRLDEKLSPQPELAERWDTPDEGKSWRFFLNRNARWHDGVPFTSQDVKVHFERVIDPKTGSPGEQIFGAIERIETPDEHTAVFRLKAFDADFPAKHGSYEGLIQAAHIPPTSYLKSIVGTGPFKLDKIVPGESIRLIKNAMYFQADQPLLDSLTFVSFSDEQARLNALLSGHIQVSVELPYDIAQQLSQRGDIYLSKSMPAAMLLLAMRLDQKPFGDERVRKAVSLTLDREALLQVAVKGFGQVGGDNPIGPGRPYYLLY
jgi:peptide/nickel transport system substrate-binding protein